MSLIDTQEYAVITYYSDGGISVEYIEADDTSFEAARKVVQETKSMIGAGFSYATIAKVVDFIE